MLSANLLCGAQPLVGVRRRQPDVDDRHVGRVAPHLEEEIAGGDALADDFESSLGQQPREALAQEHAVLGEGYAHGISARTRVPPPVVLDTRRRPPSTSTRSARPRSPEPPSVPAPPTPSSTTSTTSWRFACLTSTVTLEAWAYLATFV